MANPGGGELRLKIRNATKMSGFHFIIQGLGKRTLQDHQEPQSARRFVQSPTVWMFKDIHTKGGLKRGVVVPGLLALETVVLPLKNFTMARVSARLAEVRLPSRGFLECWVGP